MISDDERREVASNIMENYVCGGLGYKVASAYNIAMAIGMNPGLLVGDIELWERLADLIEPDHVGDSNKMVDRDALLELADEIEDSDVTYCVSAQYVLDSYAARIREALGVSGDE